MLQSVPTLLTDVEAQILKHEDSLVVTQYKDLFEEEKKNRTRRKESDI